MAEARTTTALEIDGRELVVTNGGKLLVPEAGIT